MSDAGFDTRRLLEQLERPALQALQLCKLNVLLETILPDNGFYAAKLARVKFPLPSLDALSDVPLLTGIA